MAMSDPLRGQISLLGAIAEGTPTRRDYCLMDDSERALAQPWVDITCRQMAPGQGVGRLTTVSLGVAHVVREDQAATVHKFGVLPPHLCTVSIADGERASLRFSQFARDATKKLFLLPGGREFDIHVSSGTRTVYAVFDQATLLSKVRQFAPEYWAFIPRDLVAVDTPYRSVLSSALSTLLAMESFGPNGPAPAEARCLGGAVMDAAALALAGGPGRHPILSTGDRARHRLVHTLRAARDYIEACAEQGDMPSMAEICGHAGVSERTLQYAFREGLGVTPMTYLRAVRLNGARSALTAPSRQDLTVTEVAMRWGFLHLGRFSTGYKQLFRETPSQTLTRALAAKN